MDDIINWYTLNVTPSVNISVLIKILLQIFNNINKDMIDDFLLEKVNDEFVVENGKFKLKNNRLAYINSNSDKILKPQKYKLKIGKHKNYKLIKLN